jgi:hypothetical protein
VPPLEQPRLLVLPAGVCTATSKLPGAGIIDALIVTVAWELLSTEVASVAPLKSSSEEATNWAPVAVRTRREAAVKRPWLLEKSS